MFDHLPLHSEQSERVSCMKELADILHLNLWNDNTMLYENTTQCIVLYNLKNNNEIGLKWFLPLPPP